MKTYFAIYHKGQLVTKTSKLGFPLTFARAKWRKQELMKEKGWAEANIEIKPIPDSSVKEGNN